MNKIIRNKFKGLIVMDKTQEQKLREQIKKLQALYRKAEKQKNIHIGWKLSGGNID